MKKMFVLLSLCALGCSSGKADPSAQPQGMAGLVAQALPGQDQQAQPPQEAQPAPTQPAPTQPAPMQPAPLPAAPLPAAPAQPAPVPPDQSAPAAPEPSEPGEFEQAEAPPSALPPAPPAGAAPVDPAQPAQPADQGNADVCSAMCDRVAACQIATKEVCMPACTPEVPQLTPEQRAQVIAAMSGMACEDLSRFGAQQGNASPGDGS
jgi:hypothetical protein